jgi:hypothetical protein
VVVVPVVGVVVAGVLVVVGVEVVVDEVVWVCVVVVVVGVVDVEVVRGSVVVAVVSVEVPVWEEVPTVLPQSWFASVSTVFAPWLRSETSVGLIDAGSWAICVRR